MVRLRRGARDGEVRSKSGTSHISKTAMRNSAASSRASTCAFTSSCTSSRSGPDSASRLGGEYVDRSARAYCISNPLEEEESSSPAE